ncbi:MAG: ferric reductase-like transmembrane domain-containing protein [Methylobacteriaceae bacterium]|nr:ferric reductase-like transmembrane domain-containing protein [Methylobacteriaceae bacterium]
MTRIRAALLGVFLVPTLLWLAADATILSTTQFMPLRNALVQYTGVLAISAMSVAMLLAMRPASLETPLGGLDKMYRLHKWLGVAGLGAAIAHWLAAQGPKWAVSYGLMRRGARPPAPPIDNALVQALADMRGLAEGLGEKAFYLAAILIALALVRSIPYRFVFRTHVALAAVYLVLVFHSVVLMKTGYWTTPLGVTLAALMLSGSVAALLSLTRRIGADRKVEGRITRLRHWPALKSLEFEIDVPKGWPGHSAGQFAFVTVDRREGAHPFTIASDWRQGDTSLLFIAKALGDHTARLAEQAKVGQTVTVEGPYGRFTFDDPSPRQIWVGGGIGVTPFIARMKVLARRRAAGETPKVDFFHTTADLDERAIALLQRDADAAGVRLHVLHDARDGLLDGERIRRLAPEWARASLWFCGPTKFGAALRKDFARRGLDVSRRFHQELFAMR